ncbi:MAG: hypothetical protein KY457_00495 [Actinobacteria bacterium]|nr:hypothetical protein [Actinomycetota bacterium]
MRQKKLSKKVDKLEKKAEKLGAKAAAKAGEVSGKAQARGKDLSDRAAIKMGVKEEPKSGKKGLFTLVAAAAAGLGFFLKKKREQELDEALWEEPRAL